MKDQQQNKSMRGKRSKQNKRKRKPGVKKKSIGRIAKIKESSKKLTQKKLEV